VVRLEPVTIPGVAGPVVVDLKLFSNKHVVTVGGRPAARVGRATYELPASNGRRVVGKLRNNGFDPYPTVEIDGVKHRTGPRLPIALRVLALLPAPLLVIGGALGGAVAAAGVIGNMVIARTAQPATVKAALMVAVLIAATVAWLVLATALGLAIGP
jgi:hypothetical protein